jgi:hypothetical protein
MRKGIRHSTDFDHSVSKSSPKMIISGTQAWDDAVRAGFHGIYRRARGRVVMHRGTDSWLKRVAASHLQISISRSLFAILGSDKRSATKWGVGWLGQKC